MSQTDRQTDGWTDGRTTYDSNTVLCTLCIVRQKRYFTESICDQRCADCGIVPLRTVIRRKFLIRGRTADVSLTKNCGYVIFSEYSENRNYEFS